MNILNSTLKYKKLVVIFLLFCLSYCYLESQKSFVLAQTENSNPLEDTISDPLLPSQEIDRALSPLEKKRIRKAIVNLDAQAQAKLAAGNQDTAFVLWYRVLRLQRNLGRQEEINALGRIGEIAWQQNRPQNLKNISDRLLTIQTQATTENTLDRQLLSSLGKAYQQIRYLDRAVIIYQEILKNNQQADDFSAEKLTLETLGKLYLAQFSYPQAANIYEELLKSVQTPENKNYPQIANNSENKLTNNSLQEEEIYLTQLAEIYDRSSQPAKALKIKQQLVEKYLEHQKTEKLAALKISIALDNQALKQPEKARNNYQDAFALAWSLQQLALAIESLQRLALLYQEYQQFTAALKIYQELIKVEQQAYDYYGLLNTYDQIGQIHWQLKNQAQALDAFKQGLNLAKSLNYRVDYFTEKIEQSKNI